MDLLEDEKQTAFAAMLLLLAALCNCKPKDIAAKEVKAEIPEGPRKKIKSIFDTDAHNELDDQLALAYMLLNGNTYEIQGITVNATYNGAGIQSHYDEAERIMQLRNLKDAVPLLKGILVFNGARVPIKMLGYLQGCDNIQEYPEYCPRVKKNFAQKVLELISTYLTEIDTNNGTAA